MVKLFWLPSTCHSLPVTWTADTSFSLGLVESGSAVSFGLSAAIPGRATRRVASRQVQRKRHGMIEPLCGVKTVNLSPQGYLNRAGQGGSMKKGKVLVG